MAEGFVNRFVPEDFGIAAVGFCVVNVGGQRLSAAAFAFGAQRVSG